MTHSAFSTDTCAAVTSKQEAGEAVADSNHGDEAEKRRFSGTEQKEEQLTALWKQQECLYDVSSELKNAAVAESCSSVDFCWAYSKRFSQSQTKN